MKKYENYKNSGVEWLSEIPEHWQVKKLKHLIQSKTGFAFQSDKFSDEGIPLIRISDLNESGLVLLDKAPKLPQKNEKYLKEYGLKRNDILFAMTGGTIGKVATYNQDTPALLNQRVCLFRIYDKNLRKIVYYWMQTLYWKNYIDLKSIGGAQPNISDVTVLNLQIFVSNNQEEQTAIANFLDDKTTKIDQAIAIKQRQIELLKERRQILIHKAVTRGLNDNVKLKDSGVEWIGEIPEGWRITPLRHIGKTQNGISKGGEHFGTGFPFVSYGDVYRDIKLPLLVNGLVESTIEDRNQYSVLEGDIFFTRTSETVEEIGFSSTCLQTIQDATFAGFLIRFRPQKNTLHKEFSKYYFSSSTHRVFFIKKMNLVIRASLSQDLLKRLPVLLPPITEQEEIGNYLNNKTTRIASAISLKEQEIEKLKEYKMSLIDGVVTGKVKVC
jgi:type I restriction enzyme, S subunit